jgi:hypothetical protein
VTILPWISPAESVGPLLAAIVAGAGLMALARRDRRWRLIGAAVAVVLLLVPWNGRLSALVMLLGTTNGLSAATLIMLAGLAAALIAGRRPGAFQSCPLALLVLLLGAVLYPAAALANHLDPYQWGYSGWMLPAILAAIFVANLAAWRDPLVFAWLALGCALQALALYETANLWDTLIDPIAVVGAILMLAGRAAGRVRWRRRAA